MDSSRLKRPIHPMPNFVRQALLHHKVMEVYLSRPPYQQNDYIDWINRAVLEATKQKRLGQMLDELKQDFYMKMEYRPKSSKGSKNS